MTRALAMSALLLLASCAQDGSDIVMPPAQYDHEPTGQFVDYRVPFWQVDNACRTFGDFSSDHYRIAGCVVKGHLRVVPSDTPKAFTARVVRHENGHMNGWPANHPEGHF